MKLQNKAVIPQEEFMLKIAERCQPGCFYDIGAYPTRTTNYLMINLLKHQTKIIAFETSNEGYRKYKNLFSGYKQVKLYKIALGDKIGRSTLNTVTNKSYLATFYREELKKVHFLRKRKELTKK